MEMKAEDPVRLGPLTITRYDVDHDILGASGYGVRTEDGLVAFTGDLRLYGRHPEKTWDFARPVIGARALVMEGITLSFGFDVAVRSECEGDQSFAEIVRSTPGLVLVTLYSYNLEPGAPSIFLWTLPTLKGGRSCGRGAWRSF